MKRIGITLLALLLMLCLCACGGEVLSGSRLPKDVTVAGVDISGMNQEKAWAALESAVDTYALELTVDGVTLSVSGKDMDLRCSREVFDAAVAALEADTEPDWSGLIRYKDTKLRTTLGRELNKSAQEAAIVFDAATGKYQLEPHADGLRTDHNGLAGELRESIRSLAPQHSCTGFAEVLTPVWTADSEDAQKALDTANKMLGAQLTMNFGTELEPALHEISAEDLDSLITFGEDGFQPDVDTAALEAYVAELAAKYDIDPYVGPFHTSTGDVLDMVITYEGCYLDQATMAADLQAYIKDGKAGQCPVTYLPGSVRNKPFAGNYVEVNLTQQHMWFYKDGVLLTESDLVSGNVAAWNHTPTGVFEIYSRTYGTDLVGADYRSWVNFWMPFVGGYGLHDASWRSEFGGNIYLTSGSHGCINLPYDAAKIMIDNSRSGETRVIIYGGQGSQPAKEQSFKGKTEYIVPLETEPFKLDVRSRYAWPDYYYESDNPDVATVDAEGLVTIHSLGTANITVTCTTEGYFASATTNVAVHVLNLCEDGNHEMGEPEVTVEPTCVNGVETTRCTKCDYFENKSVKAVDEHTEGQWTVTLEATCDARGKQIIPCTVCGKELDSEWIAQLEHTPGQWVTSTAPDCENRGTRVIVCTVCGAQLESERLDKLGHTPSEWTVTEEPTCEERGKQVITCTVCDKQLDSERIDKLGHTPGKWEITLKSTCEEKGKRVVKCTVCEKELESENIDATGHKFNDGPSCTVCKAENPDYEAE